MEDSKAGLIGTGRKRNKNNSELQGTKPKRPRLAAVDKTELNDNDECSIVATVTKASGASGRTVKPRSRKNDELEEPTPEIVANRKRKVKNENPDIFETSSNTDETNRLIINLAETIKNEKPPSRARKLRKVLNTKPQAKCQKLETEKISGSASSTTTIHFNDILNIKLENTVDSVSSIINRGLAHTSKNATARETFHTDNDMEVDDDIFIVHEQINDVLNESRRWSAEDVVSEIVSVNRKVVQNVMGLFDNDCTIPFIARYRKEVTGGMEPEKLRELYTAYENVKAVKKKVENVAKTLSKEKKLTKEVAFSLSNATTQMEVEQIIAPLKMTGRRTLAEKAKRLGLEEGAIKILRNQHSIQQLNPLLFINPDIKDLSTIDKVLSGFQHIMADVIAKDAAVLEFMMSSCNNWSVNITSCQSAQVKKDSEVKGKPFDPAKFENYFTFSQSILAVHPHQVLALNRGEHLKILTVKIVIPPNIKNSTIHFCHQTFPSSGEYETVQLMEKTIEDAYNRLLEPTISRQIRSRLTKNAEAQSINVFCSNLKQLLLTPPVRGQVVASIDPGFSHGCKLAVLSKKGEVLETSVLYLHGKNSGSSDMQALKLKRILESHSCETIALGNGTACRETEQFLSDLIKLDYFRPLRVKYCIVNESGASTYSVTKEAEAELPGMDPNLRSAVSLARRLQDPLLEYVKVEPKHIGVGMYQHDIPESQLKVALDEVVIECVSFVGADLNVSSEIILRKISGLAPAKAKNIVAWRESNGSFKNRQQLLEVKGVGPKAFQQCAGFVKILPQTCSIFTCKPSSKGKNHQLNPFDMTVIHPESYKIAQSFLDLIEMDVSLVGQEVMIQKVKSFLRSQSVIFLANKFSVPITTIQLIVDALQQPVEYDFRAEFEKPLFKTGVRSLDELKVDQILTGKVNNVTHFGAFVDVGVGQDGLIHTSQMLGRTLALGDRIQIKVISLNFDKKRIGLRLVLDYEKNGSIGKEISSLFSGQQIIPSSIKQTENHKPQTKNYKLQTVKVPFGGETKLADLRPGQQLEGLVKAIKPFGVFVDIGAERDGFIHSSQLSGIRVESGQAITVQVIRVDLEQSRVSLRC